jgi:hypothetical protein
MILPHPKDTTIILANSGKQPYAAAISKLYSMTELDIPREFTIAQSDEVMKVLLESSKSDQIISGFNNGQTGVKNLLTKIQGQKTTIKNITKLISDSASDSDVKSVNRDWILRLLTILVSLVSGSGTLVVLKGQSCIYNVGYIIPNVRTGRSFSSPESGTLNPVPVFGDTVDAIQTFEDPSDVFMLKEMDKIKPDDNAYYGGLLNILLYSDASYLDQNKQVQMLVDFLSVYTAESLRYVMSEGPSVKPWNVDALQVMLLTPYTNSSGYVMSNNKLVSGKNENYYARGMHGSGIGDERRDFQALSKFIDMYMQSNHPQLMSQLSMVSSANMGNVIRNLAMYLSDPEHIEDIRTNADQLKSSTLALLNLLGSENAKITQFVQAQSSSSSHSCSE